MVHLYRCEDYWHDVVVTEINTKIPQNPVNYSYVIGSDKKIL